MHWGEEIEYNLFYLDHITKKVLLSCDAPTILAKYKELSDEEQQKIGFKLMPEFGRWMIEAVPSKPYNSYADPEQLLSCFSKISAR